MSVLWLTGFPIGWLIDFNVQLYISKFTRDGIIKNVSDAVTYLF